MPATPRAIVVVVVVVVVVVPTCAPPIQRKASALAIYAAPSVTGEGRGEATHTLLTPMATGQQ